jgi:hypothetical protein
VERIAEWATIRVCGVCRYLSGVLQAVHLGWLTGMLNFAARCDQYKEETLNVFWALRGLWRWGLDSGQGLGAKEQGLEAAHPLADSVWRIC